MEKIILNFTDFTLLGEFVILKENAVVERGSFERNKVLDLLKNSKIQNIQIIGNCPPGVKEEIVKNNYNLV